ncbi:MAG: hypothetical protein HY000_32390 [Planctomycetes bacterium]|nr:hypothetical protein [Planctomycetota bacterium]
MALIGLMITRDDEAIFDTWCADQLPLFDAVVCLDGSTTETTAKLASRFGEKLVYLHERDFDIPHKTDHGLRRVVHLEIVRRFGSGHWIMCCHLDEFCYHDPRKIVALAEEGGFDLVSWYSPHFYPHPSELTDWEERRLLPVPNRHRYYHWGYISTGLPWIEDRLYRDGPCVHWDEATHGSVRPHGIQREAPFHPIFRHFKVYATDTSWCELSGGRTHYRHHWVGLEHRTGLPYRVERFDDLFVESVLKYSFCDRFDGYFDQPWNIGEQFRPDEAANAAQEHTGQKPPGPALNAPSQAQPRRTTAHVEAAMRVAIGPENPSFPSWNRMGADLARELAADSDAAVFQDVIPDADAVVFIKFLPGPEELQEVRRRSAIVYCPFDVYGAAAEIDADALRLRCCDRIVVHCRRLLQYFQRYAQASYLDLHVKFAIPTRQSTPADGPILWVGEESNIPLLASWVNRHSLPARLVVIADVQPWTRAEELGFLQADSVRVECWSPGMQSAYLARCRAALDIKGDDFRARHKPPADALDYLASGVPLAMNRESSAVHHFRELGFEIADPLDVARWLSPEYAAECVRFGQAISELWSLRRLGLRWRVLLQEVVTAHRAASLGDASAEVALDR